jgi:hypothetical protein
MAASWDAWVANNFSLSFFTWPIAFLHVAFVNRKFWFEVDVDIVMDVGLPVLRSLENISRSKNHECESLSNTYSILKKVWTYI